ncbi:unnamed protein product, partial [Prorocentrum cordatum]
MPASTKAALERKRIANVGRARVKAVKNFLGKPWVAKTLKEAVAEFKVAAHKRLCDALATAALRSNSQHGALWEKNRKLTRQLNAATSEKQEQADELKKLRQLARDNEKLKQSNEELQEELGKAKAALADLRSTQARFNYWATPRGKKRFAWLTLHPAKWGSRRNREWRSDFDCKILAAVATAEKSEPTYLEKGWGEQLIVPTCAYDDHVVELMNSPQHRAWQPRTLRKPEVLHDHLLYKFIEFIV